MVSFTGKQKTLISANIVLTACLLMLVSVAIDDHRHVANVSAQAAALPDDFARGQYYFNHGDRADGTYDLVAARHYFSRAIQADPDGNPLAWYQLGRIDFIEGKFDAAIYKFNKQLQYFGDQVPNVYYMLGLTYGFRGRVEAPDSPDLQTGIENFEKYLEFFPDSPWARTDIAWLHFLQGEYAAMIPVLDSGLAIEPDHAWLLNMYGLALLNTGNRTEAQEAFTQAKVSAEALTTADWGRAYPGNNPADWQWGLDSFRAAIEQNIDLAEAPSQS